MNLNMAQLLGWTCRVSYQVDAPVADVDVEEPIPDAANREKHTCVLYVNIASCHQPHSIPCPLKLLDGSICGSLVEKLNPQLLMQLAKSGGVYCLLGYLRCPS